MASISVLLKEKMNERGVSAHALEKRAGLRPSAVQNILYGRSKNPSISTLQAIALALDCKLSDLIGEETSDSKTIDEKEEISWDSTLYLNCFESVNKILKEETLTLPKDRVLEAVEEIYRYSSGRNGGIVDDYFARWLINRLIK